VHGRHRPLSRRGQTVSGGGESREPGNAIAAGEKTERPHFVRVNWLSAHGNNEKPRHLTGRYFCVRRNESAFEQGAQVLRNRLVENVIIERMEEVFPIALAG
jgi:hypothetical protein